MPDFSDRAEWDIRCVRGPLTAGKLGLDTSLGIIDPAVMVSDMPEFQGLPKRKGAIFIPHWESAVGGIWPVVCQAAGVAYVDPCGDARTVIRAIAQSELVIAESMHAAILADAFRVPWVAVSTSRSINSFKWRDWAETVGVEYRPRHMPISSRGEAISKGTRFWGMEFENRAPVPDSPNGRSFDVGLVATRDRPARSTLRAIAKQALAAPSILALWQARGATPQLSSDGVLATRKERLHKVLAEIRRDYF